MILKFIKLLIGNLSKEDVNLLIKTLIPKLNNEQKKAIAEYALRMVEAGAKGAVRG